MYKGTDIIGKPMISHSDGRVLDSVKDIVFDSTQKRVLGFLLEEKGIFKKAKFVPFENLQSIGKDALTVLHDGAVVDSNEDQIAETVGNVKHVAMDTTVMSEDGRNLGKITDVYFSENNGVIEGYEVSGGVFSDIYSGKSFLPAPEQFRIGEDVAFVSNNIAEMMEEDVGGIRGAVQKAGEGIGAIRDKAVSGIQTGADKMEQGINQASEKIETEADTLGKRAQATVRSDNGEIVAAQGQIITNRIIEKAKAFHKEAELMAAAAFSRAKDINSNLRSEMDRTGNEIVQGFSAFKTKAKETIDRIKDKNMAMLEERKINDALGRPVTRIILDQNDQPILSTGDIITHQAIDKAREAGALEILLSSVYKQDPTFTSDELKAAGV